MVRSGTRRGGMVHEARAWLLGVVYRLKMNEAALAMDLELMLACVPKKCR